MKRVPIRPCVEQEHSNCYIVNSNLRTFAKLFQAHDFFGDGGIVVVCVIGYDVQIRDGKTGKLLFSASGSQPL